MPEIKIIDYNPTLRADFESINKQWIEYYFKLEQIDLNQLHYPEETIIGLGGAIIFAREGEKILGTVGLVKVEHGVYEMVKMGVVPEAQGRKVGKILATAILEKAKELGGEKVILYSNSKLEAALNLYRKLGFQDLVPECGKYSRCDVKMEIEL